MPNKTNNALQTSVRWTEPCISKHDIKVEPNVSTLNPPKQVQSNKMKTW